MFRHIISDYCIIRRVINAENNFFKCGFIISYNVSIPTDCQMVSAGESYEDNSKKTGILTYRNHFVMGEDKAEESHGLRLPEYIHIGRP